MTPALGPLSVLWTVEVTTSQCSKGDGASPAATRPDTWAMSAISREPAENQIQLWREIQTWGRECRTRTVGVGDLPEAGVVEVAGVAADAGDDDARLEEGGRGGQGVVVDQPGRGVDLKGIFLQ